MKHGSRYYADYFVASSVVDGERIPPHISKARYCKTEGCGKKLCIYNLKDVCFSCEKKQIDAELLQDSFAEARRERTAKQQKQLSDDILSEIKNGVLAKCKREDCNNIFQVRNGGRGRRKLYCSHYCGRKDKRDSIALRERVLENEANRHGVALKEGE